MAVVAVVHGSMAGPTAYTRLAKELDCRGHRALVELPVDRPELTGTDYARMVAEQLDAALAEDGTQHEPVVVVAHSASGLLLPLVPSFRPVTHLVYLAAGVPQPGMTLDEQLAAEPDMLNPAWVGVDPFQDHQAARRFLFHDCDEPTARWAIATQTPWYPEGLYLERCPLAAFPPTLAPRSSAPLTGLSSQPGRGGSPPTGCTPRWSSCLVVTARTRLVRRCWPTS
jgi:Alpha/beta hydrolase family